MKKTNKGNNEQKTQNELIQTALNLKVNEYVILTNKYNQLEYNYTEIETIRTKCVETNESYLKISDYFDEFKRESEKKIQSLNKEIDDHQEKGYATTKKLTNLNNN